MKRLKSGTTSTGGLQNADPDQKKTSNGPLMGMTGLAPQEGEVRQRPVEVPSHQDGHQNSTEEKPIRAAEAVDTGRMPCDTNEGVGQGVIHTDRESDLHASNAGEVSELRLTRLVVP